MPPATCDDREVLQQMFPKATPAMVAHMLARATLAEAAEKLLGMTEDEMKGDPVVEDDCIKLQNVFPSLQLADIREARESKGSVDGAVELLLQRIDEHRSISALVRAEAPQAAAAAAAGTQPPAPEEVLDVPPVPPQPSEPAQPQVSAPAAAPEARDGGKRSVEVAGQILSSTLELFSATARSITHSIAASRGQQPAPAAAADAAASRGASTSTASDEASNPDSAEDLLQPAVASASSRGKKPSLTQAKTALLGLLGEDEVETVFRDVQQTIAITIVGKRKTGKTSILNAMLGQPLLPSKQPAAMNYTVRCSSDAEAGTIRLACGESVVDVGLGGAPVGVVRTKMLDAVARVSERREAAGDAPLAIEVEGRGIIPERIVLNEVSAQDGRRAADFKEGVVVAVINEMDPAEVEELKAQAAGRNLLLVKTVRPGHAIEEETEDGVLVIDPLTYLSSIVLASYQVNLPAYQGSFNTYKGRVHTMIQACKRSREKREREVWDELRRIAGSKRSEWDSVLQYCEGRETDAFSRPPPSSDTAVVDGEPSPIVAEGSFTPALPSAPPSESIYQPAEAYVPASSQYQPQVSTWQPSTPSP